LKALIPAAGLGIRWLPWSRIIPKELLPFNNYPVIHHVLNEVVAPEIKEIGIIICKAKQLIKSYVDEIWIANHPEIQLRWFYQSTPRGVGDALLHAKEWVSDEPTAIIYPDEIHPKEGGISQIFKAFQSFPCCWIGLTSKKQKRRQISLAAERVNKSVFRISGPYNQACVGKVRYGTGRYILANGLSHLKGTFSQVKNQNVEEFDDSYIFAPLWGQDIRGIMLSEPIYDIGIPENWRSAVSAYIDQK